MRNKFNLGVKMDKFKKLKEYAKTERTLFPIKAIKFDKNNWDKMVEVTDGAVSKLTIVKIPYERACCMLNTGKSEILVEEGNYIVEDLSLVDKWFVVSQKVFEGMFFLNDRTCEHNFNEKYVIHKRDFEYLMKKKIC